jgi:antitoxin component YwqK of YwqJK toxin-antitoxin module
MGKINQRDSQGRRHGVWESYRSDGTLYWRVHYHHGNKYGVCEHYYQKGTLCWRANFYHDTPKGKHELYTTPGIISLKGYHLIIR